MDASTAQRMRQVSREIFLHALQQSNIDRAFDRHMGYERGILRVGEDLYDLSSFSRIVIISIGKAGNSAVQALMNRLGGGVGATGIVSAPTSPDAQVFGFRYFKGGHPLPNLESLKSAESILRVKAREVIRTRKLPSRRPAWRKAWTICSSVSRDFRMLPPGSARRV